MKISDRVIAVEWWNSLPANQKVLFYTKYENENFTLAYSYKELTGSEIENIWNLYKEDKESMELVDLEVMILGLSQADKERAFKMLYSLCKKWDGLNNGDPFYMDICRAYNAGKQSLNKQHEDNRNGIGFSTNFKSSDKYFKEEFGF